MLLPEISGRDSNSPHLYKTAWRRVVRCHAVCDFGALRVPYASDPMGSQGASSMGSVVRAWRWASVKKRLLTTAW